MSVKALITHDQRALATAARDAQQEGLQIDVVSSQGLLVHGDEAKLHALEKRGYRIKLLRDTNILHIGGYRIHTDGPPPKLPKELEVPATEVEHWPHHLLQLVAPPTTEWITEIEKHHVHVVEKVSAYGLFVIGSTDQVNQLRNLPFVTWVGLFQPAYRIHPDLAGRQGELQYVSVSVYSADQVDDVKDAIATAGGRVLRVDAAPPGYQPDYTELRIEIDAAHLPAIATRPGVRWIELIERMGPDGERETQILAENLDGAGAPVVGYQGWLDGLGLSGNGVTVAIVDTGVDANANNNASAHLDLRGRQAAFVDYTGGLGATDTNGHGTHVCGIAVGNAASAQTEAGAPADFLWGQGVAPLANYVTQNYLDGNGPQPLYPTLTQDSVNNGAQVMNNSWGGSTSAPGYTADTRQIDQLARDPNQGTAALESLVIVFSSGNNGGGPSTLTRPHEAKNAIIVGNSLTSRPAQGFPVENIRGISGTSSRGPASDGRLLPNVVAPGTDVSSTWSQTGNIGQYGNPIAGTPDPDNPANLVNQYQYISGTSQAAPHVTGSAALITEWWRARTGGRNPSPALVKALLINGAEDIGGTGGDNWRCTNRIASDKAAWALQSGNIYRRNWNFSPSAVVAANQVLTQVPLLTDLIAASQWFFDAVANVLYVWTPTGYNPGVNGVPFVHARDAAPLAQIPSTDQGWGRISLGNMFLQAPSSDRGPRLFSDQRHAFTANGQQFQVRVAPVDVNRPLRISLVWTDAPGAAGANPALVNDLDLQVTEIAGGTVYRGNVFANGFSVAGGAFDAINNVECVYVQNPTGVYEVRVIASSIVGNARPPFNNTPWQDFVLVIENAESASASPVNVVPVIDRSGSMVGSGYVDVTRLTSRAFVDLMGIDDGLGVVSFADDGVVEYPTGPGPTLQTIVGQVTRDAAKAQIDGIAFGGCTYMGDGILRARDLLAGAAGSRAMVMLSDGYDNKGCDQGNPAKPSALDAVGMLPAGLPVYPCAMGPLSDQALLEQIATSTSGRYYYMPTIDDLFEIYNYIRGQVTDSGIIVNDSASASSSRLGGFVDSGAEELTFSVAWADATLHPVLGEPRKPHEVAIRLRDPRGRLLHPNTSSVRRILGPSYAIFKIAEPLAGQWFVEVSTMGDVHVRYTVGGFVHSPLRLVTAVRPRRILPNIPIVVSAQVYDGKRPIAGPRAQVRWTWPTFDLPGLKLKYRDQLAHLKVPPGADSLPVDIAKLGLLRNQLVHNQSKDIFTYHSEVMPLTRVSDAAHGDFGLVPPTLRRSLPADALTGIVGGRFLKTQQRGSYNLVVTATGISPISNSRYVRKDLVSVVVH